MAQPNLVTLFNFDGASGSLPFGGLVEDAAGNFYGATYSGGAQDDGVIYEISAVTHDFTVLASFNGTSQGSGPIGTLSVDAAGNLYGETENSIFELANGSRSITTLATLPSYVYPSGSLVVSAQGTIYGTTANGGEFGQGSIFAIAPGQKSVTTLASFNGYDGTHPYAGLTIDAAGDLFGSAPGNTDIGAPAGIYYELPAGSDSIQTVATFNFGSYGSLGGPLVADSKGDLYGTTLNTVFEIAAGTQTPRTIATLDPNEGQGLGLGNLIVDGAGDVFGMAEGYDTSPNGQLVDGVVYEVKAGSGTAINIATFTGANGSGSDTQLVADAAGNLFGVSTSGGTNSDGTVFEIENSGFVPATPYVPPPPSPYNKTRVVLSGYGNSVSGPYAPTPGNGQTGPTIFGPAAGNATLRGTGDSGMIQAYGYNNTILANGGDDLILAGAGEATVAVSDNDGDNAITGGSGYTTIILGNGDNHIVLGGDANSVTLGDGNNIVTPGAGSATVVVGDGNNRITLSGYDNGVIAADGQDNVSGGAGYETITLGNGNNSISTGGEGNMLTVGSGRDNITAGDGADTVITGGGNDVITLAGYGNTVTTSGGNNKIVAAGSTGGNTISLGSGRDNVTLGGTDNSITLGAGTNVVVAGSGDDTVVAGTGDTSVTLSGGGNTVTLGGGHNTVVSGSGDDVIHLAGGTANLAIGGSGDMIFLGGASARISDAGSSLSLDTDAGGVAVIQGFDATSSILDLIGSPYASAASVAQHLTSDQNGGVLLALGSGSSIDFVGVASGALTAANFRIG
ncbi:MAG TPA: choice-of-anchor tandem repeat GloVer-containing protein [Rhodopila sp.]|nr:choice-of-anchor tandem repeat GloVer-containing protein [Rhodopila sp.]